MNEALSKAIAALKQITYLASGDHSTTDWNCAFKDCDEALSALSALQEARPVAFHIGNPDGTMSGLGAIYRTRHSAEYHIASYDGKLDAAIVPLYAHPQPAQQDARDAALEEAAAHIERLNESAGDAAAYDNRDMYCCEVERERTAQACADAIRSLKSDAALSAAKEKQCGS